MAWIWASLLLADALPLAAAWRANRRTSLVHAVSWALAAWVAWTAMAWGEALADRPLPVARYLALTLTGCAGVAVLGARRPGAGAWNFVVAGLGAVLLRPLLEGRGTLRLEGAHRLFLAATLAVPLFNYLPTRLALAALSLGAGCVLEACPLMDWSVPPALAMAGTTLVALAPWLAWLGIRSGDQGNEIDRLWRTYRDRMGFVWAQRMREQFNHAAAHAGWPVRLGWTGVQTIGDGQVDAGEVLTTLRAVLKRFAADQ
jgi:hypothetical protein